VVWNKYNFIYYYLYKKPIPAKRKNGVGRRTDQVTLAERVRGADI
jgi:hypothetical protein